MDKYLRKQFTRLYGNFFHFHYEPANEPVNAIQTSRINAHESTATHMLCVSDVGCACICVSTSVPPKHINTSTRSATDLSFSIQAADTVSTQFSVSNAFFRVIFRRFLRANILFISQMVHHRTLVNFQ